MEELVFKRRHSLLFQSRYASEAIKPVNGDGFGLGWYHLRAQPALFREIMPAWLEPNLRNLCHQQQSRLFFAHVRASTGTPTTKYNCHPFAHREWMFVHNGQVSDYHKIRRALDNMINESCYISREGTTDSEAIFLAILSRIESTGEAPLSASQAVLREVMQLMQKHAIEGPLRFTAALTNGTDIYAFHCGSDNVAPTLYLCQSDKGITLASEPLDTENQSWHKVGLNQALHIGPFEGAATKIHYQPFEISTA